MKKPFFLFSEDIGKMSIKQHLYYWVVPFVVLFTLMAFYFSQIPILMELVSPTRNWELGILENLQLLVILAIILLSAFAVARVEGSLLKLGFGLLALFSIFILLEEMDYGSHFGFENYFLKYFGTSNIHNIDANAKWYKRPIYLVITFLFFVAPYWNSSIQNRFIKYLIPPPRLILAAFVIFCADVIPRLIVFLKLRPDGGLGVNIGEFSELFIYYLFLLYVLQLIFTKRLSTES